MDLKEKIIKFKNLKDMKNYINKHCLNNVFLIDGLNLIIYI